MIVWSVCPQCGAEVEDLDGFGVLVHDECGYCSHPSETGQPNGDWQCDACGRVIPVPGGTKEEQ